MSGGASMSAVGEATTSTIIVNGTMIALLDRGPGQPILFLHPHTSLNTPAPVLAMLAEGRRLIAPSRAGFGHSERPPVDNLAYLYLDMMDPLDLRDTVAVGISLGA
jgi:pimeloyl-ACP methyl ester carboxylesterase